MNRAIGATTWYDTISPVDEMLNQCIFIRLKNAGADETMLQGLIDQLSDEHPDKEIVVDIDPADWRVDD